MYQRSLTATNEPVILCPGPAKVDGLVETARSRPTLDGVRRDSLLYSVSKRLLDILVSALALLLTSPGMIVLALLIRLDSVGPIIFRQQRLGKRCRPFQFFKFRTMYVDWPDRFPHLASFDFRNNDLDQVYLQLADDPRVTRLGRFLRRTSLDELPNFWNILHGEMTLVGPRPELPAMLPYYDSLLKFEVKPGLTCWAQILGRGELNFPDTIRLDEQYVRERGFLADLRILIGTVRAVVGGKGAY